MISARALTQYRGRRTERVPVSELRSRLLLAAALAVALGGCAIMPNVSATDFNMFKGSDLLHSDEYNYFYRRDQKYVRRCGSDRSRRT